MPLPGKLIISVLIIAAIITLIGFNVGYVSDVSVVFYTFSNVPIIITIGISFIAGALFAIPYAIRSTLQHKRRQKEKIERQQQKIEQSKSKRRSKSGKAAAKNTDKSSVPLPDVPSEK